jgi:hypothetical protein
MAYKRTIGVNREAGGPPVSDGNHDGNDGSRQRPDAAVNSHVLSRILPELGIRYT